MSGTEDARVTDPLPGFWSRGVVLRIRIWGRVKAGIAVFRARRHGEILVWFTYFSPRIPKLT